MLLERVDWSVHQFVRSAPLHCNVFHAHGRPFLDAPTHLYKRLCPLVGWLVGRSVGWSVGHAFVKTAKNGRIHWESLLSSGEGLKSRFRINQLMSYSVNHSLNQSFIYKPGRIVGLCWPYLKTHEGFLAGWMINWRIHERRENVLKTSERWYEDLRAWK